MTVNKRENIRFKVNPSLFAWISFNNIEFSEDCVALIDADSYKGCGLIINYDLGLSVGDVSFVKVGHLPPVKAEVRNVTDLGRGVFLIGMQYLSERT
ncbi:MAG: hypothetical protein HN353_06525 [Bdellovibrionales bacterium]|jgi:hypothetical protein|nr:hypothetical protein [Bdellovibrionales bacterium]MBT3526289.1 hypothetical protein [Bdellovibrionales bacterium]MBT7670198.1 hypothetical protein [Bdellovibrionales bacterium]MBT7765870.1 hypothetical protein [Bdellovibrionales bacterium]